jgi:hypothetical protein
MDIVLENKSLFFRQVTNLLPIIGNLSDLLQPVAPTQS